MGGECVVVDAVAIEPVSAPNSLLTGKLTGNFADIRPSRRFSRPVSQRIQLLADKFRKRGKSRGCQAEAQRRLTSVGKDGMSMQFGTASRDPR